MRFLFLISAFFLAAISIAEALPGRIKEVNGVWSVTTPPRKIVPISAERVPTNIYRRFEDGKKGYLNHIPKAKAPKEEHVRWLESRGYRFDAESFVNAARAGEMDVVEVFLNGGIDINSHNNFGDTALMAAAGANGLDMMRYLIGKKVDVNRIGKGVVKETALIVAARRSHGGAVNLLLDAGADVHAVGRDNWTALFFAVAENDLVMANLLVKLGAKANHLDRFGLSPLMVSVQKGYTEMTLLLLKEGANINVRDFSGNSPLILAVFGRNYTIAKMLLDAGSNPNQTTSRGWPLIDLALNRGFLDLANLLLAYGAKRPKIFGSDQ